MMKIAVSTATILLLLGTTALAQEEGKKRDDTLDKAGEIASQPARDVGIEKTQVPPILVAAEENPYAAPSGKTCKALNGDMAALNKVLGPDFTIGREANEDRTSKIAEGVGKSLVNSLIPFRGVVREISGAAPAERRLRAAIAAGLARRGYLRGMASAKGCKITG